MRESCCRRTQLSAVNGDGERWMTCGGGNLWLFPQNFPLSFLFRDSSAWGLQRKTICWQKWKSRPSADSMFITENLSRQSHPTPTAPCNHDPQFPISAELSAVIKATVSSPPGIIPLYSSFKTQRIPHARFPRESRVREHASFSPLPSCFHGQGSLWNCAALGNLCPASVYSVCILAGSVWLAAQGPLGKRWSWNSMAEWCNHCDVYAWKHRCAAEGFAYPVFFSSEVQRELLLSFLLDKSVFYL